MAEGPDMEAGVRSLLEINGLSYRMTPGMSVATSRVTREWNAIRASYSPGDILSFPVSSGAAYIDPDNSYLAFNVVIQLNAGAGGPYSPNGSNNLFFWGSDRMGRQNCLNLFKDMRYTHSSGYEVDRVTRGFAPWKYIQHAYTKDEEWHMTVGSLLRGVQTSQNASVYAYNDGSGPAYGRSISATGNATYPPPLGQIATAAQAVDAEDMFYDSNHNVFAGKFMNNPEMRPFSSDVNNDAITIRCIVPLSCISGIFDNDQLSPSFLVAGSRLDLTLQDKTQVWQIKTKDGGAPTNNYNYSIQDPRIVLETITFTDAVLRAISMTSANVGLEIPFTAMHYSNAPIGTSDMSIQVNRGLSRANMVIVRLYPNTAADNTGRCAALDSVAAYQVTPDVQGWQAKLGAEFMPAVPISDPLQLYHAVQTAFGNWKADRRNTVKMVDYIGGQSFGPSLAPLQQFCPYSTLGIYAMTLEKSTTLAQSGSPISAARDLNVVFGSPNLMVYNSPVWNNLAADVYIPYVQLATVFLDSVLTRS